MILYDLSHVHMLCIEQWLAYTRYSIKYLLSEKEWRIKQRLWWRKQSNIIQSNSEKSLLEVFSREAFNKIISFDTETLPALLLYFPSQKHTLQYLWVVY